MIRLAAVLPDREIVASLSRQLAWTHVGVFQTEEIEDATFPENLSRTAALSIISKAIC